MKKTCPKLYKGCLHMLLYSDIPIAISVPLFIVILLIIGVSPAVLGLALLYSYFDVVKFISIHTAIGAILTYAYVLRVWRFITKDIDSILKDLFYEARDIYYSEQDPEIRTTVYIHMDWLRSNKF